MANFEENPYKVIMSISEGVLMHDLIEARVTSINRSTKTVDVEFFEPYYPRTESTHFGNVQQYGYERGGSDPIASLTNVPIVYNCKKQEQNPASAFKVGDNVLILAANGSYFCVGFPDKIKSCGEYVLVTLDGYAILWDLAANEMASVPGVTFPCDANDTALIEFLSQLEATGTEIFDDYDPNGCPLPEQYETLGTRCTPSCEPPLLSAAGGGGCEDCDYINNYGRPHVVRSCEFYMGDCAGGMCNDPFVGDHCSRQLIYDMSIYREQWLCNVHGHDIDIRLAFDMPNNSCYTCTPSPDQKAIVDCSGSGQANLLYLGSAVEEWNPEEVYATCQQDCSENPDDCSPVPPYWSIKTVYRHEPHNQWNPVLRLDGQASGFYVVIVAVSSHLYVFESATINCHPEFVYGSTEQDFGDTDCDNDPNHILEYDDYVPRAVAIVGHSESGELGSVDPATYEPNPDLSEAILQLIGAARQGLDPKDLSSPYDLDVRLYK